MSEKRVSKKEATNQKTGRLKKGYRAKGGGVYVKVTATTTKRKTTKKKTTRRKSTKGKTTKLKLTKKVKKLFR